KESHCSIIRSRRRDERRRQRRIGIRIGSRQSRRRNLTRYIRLITDQTALLLQFLGAAQYVFGMYRLQWLHLVAPTPYIVDVVRNKRFGDELPYRTFIPGGADLLCGVQRLVAVLDEGEVVFPVVDESVIDGCKANRLAVAQHLSAGRRRLDDEAAFDAAGQ